jgi:hypothetical protein
MKERTAWSLPQVVCGMTGTKSFWNMAAGDTQHHERTDHPKQRGLAEDASAGPGEAEPASRNI